MTSDHIRSTLGEALVLPGGQVVPNRLLKSAMSETLGDGSGAPTEAHVQLYERWARGGIGLSVTGNVMVDRRAFGEPGNVAVEDGRDLPLLRRWAQAGKSGGGLIYVQLNHPGRQVPRFLNADAVAPSAVAWKPSLRRLMARSRELKSVEIVEIIERFAAASTVLADAGFDGIQIHGAHGYLVSQFLSPRTNQRTDEWGGTPENRRRFVLQVIRAVRAAVPKSFGVGIKINSADFQRGGISEEEAMETVAALDSEGLQFIEVSGGTYEAPAMVGARRKSTEEREAYFLAFAEKVRGRLATPLVVTGGFRSGAAMAEAIDSGAVDLVGMARVLAVRPDFPTELVKQGDVSYPLASMKTGLASVDKMGVAELAWYERQMHLMGTGSEPRPNEHVFRALLALGMRNGLNALKPRRG